MAAEIKDTWLKELSFFIVEANKQTWAANSNKLVAERKGYKEFEYKKGLWRLRDSYTGYYRAPGMTTVYYNECPVWMMQYAGHGLVKGYEFRAEEIFTFLKEALLHVTPDKPFRGPKEYKILNKCYTFTLLKGDITDGLWEENITENGKLLFSQIGLIGLIVHKDAREKSVDFS